MLQLAKDDEIPDRKHEGRRSNHQMTRRTPFRDIENDLKDLEAEITTEIEEYLVISRAPRTGELTTKDGEPVDPDDVPAYH